ncbi:MAG TPA: alpha/beta hydrolase [Anaerolineae bacterium]|nr:alpha/beta hydrolase [Anaerolineae bacterium]
MSQPKFAGYFHNGIPYNRVGHGPRNLVIFQGLLFVNKPQPPLMATIFNSYYSSLEEDYTTYIALRKPGLPGGCSMRDMSDDYAAMIREEFGEPIDVIGVSTGGSIAQHFAADHPDLVRKLVIHSSAYVLSDSTKEIQMRVADLARQRQWSAAYATMFSPVVSNRGAWRYVARPVVWIASLVAGKFGAPDGPSDVVVTIEAEDKHNFKDRLAQITVPTLVIAGDKDPFYSEALFRETAEGIPNARLILYPGMGHPAGGKQFRRDVLAFLREEA